MIQTPQNSHYSHSDINRTGIVYFYQVLYLSKVTEDTQDLTTNFYQHRIQQEVNQHPPQSVSVNKSLLIGIFYPVLEIYMPFSTPPMPHGVDENMISL